MPTCGIYVQDAATVIINVCFNALYDSQHCSSPGWTLLVTLHRIDYSRMSLPVTSVLWKAPVNDRAVTEDDFKVATTSLNPEDLQDGEVLVELLYLSVDPYLRGRMREMKSYYFIGPFQPDQPLSSGGVGVVKASKTDSYQPGDIVSGMMPWSTYAVLGKQEQSMLEKVSKSDVAGRVPLSYLLGAIGMPGMTAYASIKKIAQPKRGEVVFISGAAGAVGLVAGQLLKHVYGCVVIGSAGSDDKVALLKELGFDHAFNYKTTDTAAALAAAAPDGLDIYFDNVGGQTLEVVLDQAREHARIVACGMISQYDLPDEKKYGVKNLFNIITKRIMMQGFIVSDYMAELGAEFMTNMTEYVQAGKVKVHEKVTEGIEHAGQAFVDMMSGGNIGKAVVKVCKEDPFPVNA